MSSTRTRHLQLVATLPNHYTTKADYIILVEKFFLFNAFSTENPPPNAVSRRSSRIKRRYWQLIKKKRKKNSVNAFHGSEWMKADTSRQRSTTQNKCFLISISAVTLKLMVKITSIFGSYRFLRIAWHDIFSLSDHFPESWNLYKVYPRDLAESKRKCSSSRQSNPEVNHRTHLKDSFVS